MYYIWLTADYEGVETPLDSEVSRSGLGAND